MSGDVLSIYLADHLSGATAGSSRMRRLAEHERAAVDGAVLAAVAAEIEQDRQTLLDILAAVRVPPSWYKTVMALLVERIGLLKTNGRLLRRSPLTSVIELELMTAAVTGKLAMWEALQHTDLHEEFDFDALVQRASHQIERLRAAHLARARVMFHEAVSTATS